jgi:hypothetical protein
MVLTDKIKCNGIKPLRSAVYLLAAELQETEGIYTFKGAILEAFKSYDYYEYDYYDYDYDYEYDYYDYYDYDYYYYYYDYSSTEKTLALLFLSAMYASKGE